MASGPTLTTAPAALIPPEQIAAGRNILVVDEAIARLEALMGSLSGAGFSVNVASNASEALEQIRESPVELVLLGDSLPGMSGLDLLHLLRAVWTPQQLPVIMLSPSGETAALSAGANDYIMLSADNARALARICSQLHQKDAAQRIRDRSERAFRATAVSTDVIWEWNIPTGELWFSSEWDRISGRPHAGPKQLEDWLAFVHPDDAHALRGSLTHLFDKPEQHEFRQEYRLCTVCGAIRWIYCRANIERDRDGSPLRLTGLQTDITRNKTIDPLTKLSNRENILARVDRNLMAIRELGSGAFALLLLDIDRFRVVNESFGASAGDQILREIALRLERATRTGPCADRPEDYLARIQGDTFLLILHDVDNIDVVRAIADRLQAQVRRPVQLDGRQVRLSASVGFTLSSSDLYHHGFELLRDAEIALHQAKSLGRARTANFDPEMRRDALQRMDLEIDLRHALDRHEFVLHYQPKIDLATGALAGFEALIRWRHPQRGLVPPLTFIPVAEETGMIVPIGSWALEQSARQFSQWKSMLPCHGFQMSVNLSVKQFFDRELVNSVDHLIRELHLPPGDFCLEVTESVLIGEMQAAAEVLQRLHAAGAGLLIDDFGTGYSSLNYLTNLPFDGLKIDRSFINRVGEDAGCAEIVKAVVRLAGNLRLDVVAEGVETERQLEYLRRMGCRFAQGFYFATPTDADTATAMVMASRPALAIR